MTSGKGSTPGIILYCLAAVVFTFVFHEFAHWSLGELMGYDMGMTLNKAYPVAGTFKNEWHYHLVSAIGPAVTLIQSFVCYILIKRNSWHVLFPFLLCSFYLEVLSGVMNLRRPNDLGRIGQFLDIGLLTLPLIFVSAHVFLTGITIRMQEYNWKFVLVTFLWILVFSSIWILANQKYWIVLL